MIAGPRLVEIDTRFQREWRLQRTTWVRKAPGLDTASRMILTLERPGWRCPDEA